MFDKATRLKLRFDTPKGELSVEDLWDLPLTSQTGKANLDDLARSLDRQIRDAGSMVSFVNPTSQTESTKLQLQFDIVKHIIDVRIAERQEAEAKKANSERKQTLLAIIAQKESAELQGASLEDLRKMVEAL